MSAISNIHLILFISIIFFYIKIFKSLKNTKSFFFLSIIIVLYFLCDNFRLLSGNSLLDISIFMIKDIVLFLVTISILNKKIIKKYISFIYNNKFLFLVISIFLVINFLISKEKFFFFFGFYDLFFIPLILLYLYEKKVNKEEIIDVIKFIMIVFTLIFVIQFINLDFYVSKLLNNVDKNLIDIIYEKKAYNPKINDNTAVFIHQFSSVFNNAGRLNHFLVPFFGILIFLYLFTKEKFFVISIYLTFFFIIINSSRFTLILCSLLLLPLIFNEFKKFFSNKNILIIIFSLFIIYLSTFFFFNKFHDYKFNKKIQSNKILLIIYHNFYEPITSSFDPGMSKRPSSITGRIGLIGTEIDKLIIIDSNSTINILFGNGIGTHSLVTKHLDKNNKYKYENSFAILIYEFGLIGLLIIFFVYLKFSLFYLKKLKLKDSKDYFYFMKILLSFPLILLLTGYQFYRDYAFQFFFFLLIGIVLNLILRDKNPEENSLT